MVHAQGTHRSWNDPDPIDSGLLTVSGGTWGIRRGQARAGQQGSPHHHILLQNL